MQRVKFELYFICTASDEVEVYYKYQYWAPNIFYILIWKEILQNINIKMITMKHNLVGASGQTVDFRSEMCFSNIVRTPTDLDEVLSHSLQANSALPRFITQRLFPQCLKLIANLSLNYQSLLSAKYNLHAPYCTVL